MCRIAGLWNFSSSKNIDEKQLIASMRDSMSYGGPDHAGLWNDEALNIYLGHRRLSILDLSPAGNQPYIWDKYRLVFNGEIYNFQDINKELTEFEFNSTSDTETLVKSWHKWGIDAIHKYRGMFAFALFDTTENKLFLVRDRLGVKPLYYYYSDGLLLFGSELKSLLQYKDLDKTIDQQSLALFLQQGYIPSPKSIFKHVKKVKPGHILEINASGDVKERCYWNAEDQYAQKENVPNSHQEWKEFITDELSVSSNYRMVADVPVGSFLSGGIDSSLVSALIQKKSTKQLKTFTIGFHQQEYNEAIYAKEIAKHLDTDHYELYVDEAKFEEVIPEHPYLLDEPMGDPSIIPTHIVSKLAKQEVKVSLSADGGDEFFGGYTKYEITKNLYPKIEKLPGFAKSAGYKILEEVDPFSIEKFSSKIPVLKNYKNLGPKLLKFKNAIHAKDQIEFFNITSTFLQNDEVEKLIGQRSERIDFDLPEIDPNRIMSYLGLIDVKTYLEGDILTKVDRATMHTALEGREPLLDHILFEKAMQLPDHLKIDGTNTKKILRDILFDMVPRELIERPKQGFSVPIEKWMRTVLKDQIESLKNDQDFLTAFQLNKEAVNDIINQFQKNNKNPQVVWYFYVLYVWFKTWMR